MYQSTYYVDKTTDTFADVLLALFASAPNDVDEALAAWKAMKKQRKLKAKDIVTPVQVLNPGMGVPGKTAGLLSERLPRIEKSTMDRSGKSCISRSEVISAPATARGTACHTATGGGSGREFRAFARSRRMARR